MSFINHVMEICEVEPVVGMGCTILMYSDRHAATIVMVDGDAVVIQEDHAKRVDNNGMSESQKYEFSPNPEAARRRFTLRVSGIWVEAGYSKSRGCKLSIGHRSEYRDYSY